MSTKEELINEMNEKIEQAKAADGFFITISRREGHKLHHYQVHTNYDPLDCLLTLNEIEKLIRDAHPDRVVNVGQTKPRKFN